MGSIERRRSRAKRGILISVILVSLCLVGLGYLLTSESEAQGIKASFSTATGTTPPYILEIAATGPERQKGLMFRRELKPDRGMIFVFAEPTVQRFWMKDTYISLDMLFLDSNFTVVGILPDVPVLNTDPRFVEKPSKYVVELAAGSAARAGIKEGAKMTIVKGSLPPAR